MNPSGIEQAAELERLLALGATRVDVGQSDDVPWVVLADPEGNEFCLLGRRIDESEVADARDDAVHHRGRGALHGRSGR